MKINEDVRNRNNNTSNNFFKSYKKDKKPSTLNGSFGSNSEIKDYQDVENCDDVDNEPRIDATIDEIP